MDYLTPIGSLLASLLLGLATASSPCSIPILLSVLPLKVRGSGRSGVVTCFLTVGGVVMGVGVLVVLAGFVIGYFNILKYAVGLVLVVLGLIVVVGRRFKISFTYKHISGRGIATVCAGYALF